MSTCHFSEVIKFVEVNRQCKHGLQCLAHSDLYVKIFQCVKELQLKLKSYNWKNTA